MLVYEHSKVMIALGAFCEHTLRTKSEFVLRAGLYILVATLLFSCSPVTEGARQPPTPPPALASQPVTQISSTPDVAIFATPTPSLSTTQLPSLSPTPSSAPQYRIPGRFVIVADGEIFVVTVSCTRTWNACSSIKIQLTNTPSPEQEFAAEIFSDQITASPDGKHIAFAYRQSQEYQGLPRGGWDIYVLDIEVCQGFINGCDSQLFTRLTEEPFDEISPAWAPDGSLIAFTSNHGPYEPFLNPYELFVMHTDGSSKERIVGGEDIYGITGSILHPAWSPDSQEIVFNVMTGLYRHPDTFVYTASRDGSDVRQLTYLPHEENMNKTDFRPQWSPDGTQILFESNREPSGLYLMNSDGSDLMFLIEQGWFPCWSPDGTMIASVSSSGLAVLVRDSGRIVYLELETNIRIFTWIE
jgi:Tol biopolymer transport system component